MLKLTLLTGLWSSTCIQTQINGKQGFAKETFEIKPGGKFKFTRNWYEDPECKKLKDSDTETGKIKLGQKLSGMFISSDTYEADFITDNGTDFGAISLDKNTLKIARGMKNSTMRNTMLGILNYTKGRVKKGK